MRVVRWVEALIGKLVEGRLNPMACSAASYALRFTT